MGADIGIDTKLLVMALRDPDPFVRVDALAAAFVDDDTVDAIVGALGDDYPLVRREAVRALARFDGSRAARELLGAAAHDPSAEVREEAVEVLASMVRAPRHERAGF